MVGELRSTKPRTLKDIVAGRSEKPTFLIQAHDGLSARIGEQAGFDGIWVSSFAVSTVLGRRDCSEVPLPKYLDAIETIRSNTILPLLVDGDSGFGDHEAIRQVTQKTSQLGIGGIVFEDNPYPKTNSFIKGQKHLVDVDVHCARIASALEIKNSAPDYLVVARTEALIAGLNISKARERALAYHEAGADAIFIHSKFPNISEILAFAESWQQRCPLIIAPTAFPEVKLSELEGTGITVVIAANQLLRAAAGAMLDAADRIIKQGSVELELPSMQNIFDLIGY